MKTPRPLLCLTLIIAAMLFAAGCQRAAITESTDPKQAVVGALEKLKTRSSYYCAMRFELQEKPAPWETHIYDEQPDKFWVKADTKDGVTESMYLPDGFYIKSSDKDWIKMKDDGTREMINSFRAKSIDTSKISDATLTGKEQISGKTYFVYSYLNAGWSKRKIWVSPETGLPSKVVFYDKTGSITQSYDYEKKVSLAPPV